jgi:hypothetical protein
MKTLTERKPVALSETIPSAEEILLQEIDFATDYLSDLWREAETEIPPVPERTDRNEASRRARFNYD